MYAHCILFCYWIPLKRAWRHSLCTPPLGFCTHWWDQLWPFPLQTDPSQLYQPFLICALKISWLSVRLSLAAQYCFLFCLCFFFLYLWVIRLIFHRKVFQSWVFSTREHDFDLSIVRSSQSVNITLMFWPSWTENNNLIELHTEELLKSNPFNWTLFKKQIFAC